MSQVFHFALGPVGGFISSARRARDYWAGSFILSWLSANAIAAAIDKGAEITSPVRVKTAVAPSDDPLLYNVWAKQQGKTPLPRIDYVSRLPNTFRALSDDPDLGNVCRQAVLDAWCNLADAVWDHFVAGVTPAPPDLKTRWDEQIGNAGASFWETYWVQGEPANPTDPEDWMAARKRVRLPFFAGDIGEGERCMMMPDFRELSGYKRVGQGKPQQDFWEGLRDHVSRQEYKHRPGAKTLELRPRERLSAPALVKRLFAKLPQEKLEAVFGWSPENFDIWKARTEKLWPGMKTAGLSARFYPSTSAIAAHYWFDAVRRLCPVGDMGVVTSAVEVLSWPLAVAERQNRLWEVELWESATTSLKVSDEIAKFCALDGRVVRKNTWRNRKFLKELGIAADDNRIGHVRDALTRLKGDLDNLPKEPSRYYAVLQMDGDKMGVLHSREAEKTENALNAFAAAVRGDGDPNIVAGTMDHLGGKGEILYAGADEVRAMVTLDDALELACEIRERFTGAFKAQGLAAASISASVVFAPDDLSLGWVMRESDALLKRAKSEGKGNCLAISVMDFGRERSEIMMSWDFRPHVAGETLLAFLVRAQQEALSRDIWTTNRFVHDLAWLIRCNGPDDPKAALAGFDVKEFAARGRDALVEEIKALALRIGKEEKGAVSGIRQEISDNARSLAGLLAPRCGAASAQDRYDGDLSNLDTYLSSGAGLSLDGLEILRLLVRERRRIPDGGSSP